MLAVTFCEMGGGQDENYVLGGAESWVSDSNGGTQQPLGVASWGGGGESQPQFLTSGFL